MRYSDDIIEDVRMKNDIVDVISQYVKLTRKGSSYFGLCPFHNEKTPSFSVTPSKQMYYCFGCGAGGNVYTFIMEYENLSFGEAVKHLADRAGVELPKIEYSREAREKAERRAALLEINKQAAQYFYYQLRRENGARAYQYLTDRGLSNETIRKFGLGYSDKYSDDLYKYLKGKNYSDDLLRESGLFNVDERHGMYDKFWNRVIFPIMDVNNRVIGFGGRVMGDAKPKYLNSPETKIFDKSRNLYGLNIARTTRKNYLILCEGYMDVISMHQAGFTNAVASLGTALTSGHASLLKRYTQEVLLLYDSDEAGIRAALRAIPILREAGVNSRVVSLKPYKDPDEFIKNLGAEAFEERLGQAMDSFMFRVSIAEGEFPMEEPQGQNRFFERCAQMLLELNDELERNLYIEAIVKKYRGRYGISSEDLRKRVNTLAIKGTPAEQRIQPKSSGEMKKKKESAGEKAQKLMLTWLVTYPGIFDTVEKYLSPSDFVVPLYRQVAEMLYEQKANGEVNPARLLNAFSDSEEQREVASLFNATIHLESEQEQNRAFADTLLRIKEESLAERNRTWDPTDMNGLQELVKAKKELEELGRKRQQLHISFE
ncbi:DNA primase [Blautia sp. HCP3S3_G3]|uniref:DNA primase n=1 Tax=Blautia sp. HCP3S3_G3 TaxID=3438913 RepID=UPI003F8C8EAA